MEVTLNFVDCLLCDVTFCPVTLASQSEDEKLLDIFCHYFDLSSKDVETVYDERVGFPFCDNCRVGTLLSLSQFHDQLTSIQNAINQLVTNVCKSIASIVSQHNVNVDSHPIGHGQEQDADNAENYSKEAITSIRQSITKRFNPQVPLIQLDFQTLRRHGNNLDKRKKKQEMDNSEELMSEVDPSSIVEAIKDEPFSPSVSFKEEESDEKSDLDSLFDLGLQFAEMESSSNAASLPSDSVSRKSKTFKRAKPKSTYSKIDTDEKEIDKDGPSNSKTSPVKTGPRKVGRPRKGFELNKKLIPKKWKRGSGDPKEREYRRAKKLRDKTDPLIEVEPNLFRRKESGWSFRKEQIEGVEMFVCLAKGCPGKYALEQRMLQHITLEHINNKRVKCSKCDKSYWTQEQLEQHICVPQVPSGTTICKKTQDFGNGQYVFEGIWPFHEVDVVENGGCDMKCGTCGALEREKVRMVDHIRRIHIKKREKKFACEVCSKSFYSNEAVRRHLTTHSDKREVVCEQCGASFKVRGTLRKHIKDKHEGAPKSFKCDFPNCGRAYSQSSCLARHRKSEGHPKQAQPEQRFLIDPIICPLCTKKFVREKLYNKHWATCQGKKQFMCPICNKSSVTAQALRIHMAVMHKDEYMNYPEGRLTTDPNKTADEEIARLRLTSKKLDTQRREKMRAQALQERMEKLKKSKNNPSTSSS